MKKKYLVKSLVFFALVGALPLLKVFLLGQFDSGEQSKYIRVYFWIQFLVPVIDLGYYWSAVREKVTEKVVDIEPCRLNLVGALLALAVLPFGVFYSQLLLLATIAAWYNFRLQIFRIEGNSRAYYFMRLTKVLLDIVFVFNLYFISKLEVSMLLVAEFISIAAVVVAVDCRKYLAGSIFTFNYSQLFSSNFLYIVLKVSRSNIVRLLIPLLFLGQGMEGVLFAVLFYELVAQYISIEKLKDLLAGKIKVIKYVIVYLFSLPAQYFLIYVMAHVMGWQFGALEITCVVLGGSARIFSIYTLNVIKNNAFDLLLLLNIFLVVFGVVEIYGFRQFFVGEISAQLAVLMFFSVEALIGLGLVVWLEYSNSTKRFSNSK